MPPLGELPSEYSHAVWCVKTRMAWLLDGEKSLMIRLVVSIEYWRVSNGRTDRQTDRQTDTARRHRLRIASRGKNRSNCSHCSEDAIVAYREDIGVEFVFESDAYNVSLSAELPATSARLLGH